ncbi:MAG: beta-carotene ketolase, partial [Pseudobdellovibrionaceae bacterium]
FGYAGFSFRDLEAKHHQHHDHVATLKDPDFHNGKNESFWPWYFHFMWTYRSFKPFLFFQVSFVIMFFGFGVSLTDFMVYWAVPAILSSLQLFILEPI